MRTNKLASFKLLSIYREQFVAANSLERLTSDDKSNFGFFPQKNPVSFETGLFLNNLSLSSRERLSRE